VSTTIGATIVTTDAVVDWRTGSPTHADPLAGQPAGTGPIVVDVPLIAPPGGKLGLPGVSVIVLPGATWEVFLHSRRKYTGYVMVAPWPTVPRWMSVWALGRSWSPSALIESA
jgi:hypothetical protein